MVEKRRNGVRRSGPTRAERGNEAHLASIGVLVDELPSLPPSLRLVCGSTSAALEPQPTRAWKTTMTAGGIRAKGHVDRVYIEHE